MRRSRCTLAPHRRRFRHTLRHPPWPRLHSSRHRPTRLLLLVSLLLRLLRLPLPQLRVLICLLLPRIPVRPYQLLLLLSLPALTLLLQLLLVLLLRPPMLLLPILFRQH